MSAQVSDNGFDDVAGNFNPVDYFDSVICVVQSFVSAAGSCVEDFDEAEAACEIQESFKTFHNYFQKTCARNCNAPVFMEITYVDLARS